jgi:hypothetical protein
VRRLKSLDVFEVSPSPGGAGIGTDTIETRAEGAAVESVRRIRQQFLGCAHADESRAAAMTEQLRFIRNHS